MQEDEDEPGAEELRDAEALARALDDEPGAGGAPGDALEAAGLLRFAQGGGRLAPHVQSRIAAAARDSAGRDPASAAARPRRLASLSRLSPLSRWSGALAAAALLALLVRSRLDAPRAAEFPAAPAALLEAQARAARGDPDALHALDREMRGYRKQLYARLGLVPEARP